ncbi:sensor histidine kinase [Ferruginibacter sp. SUN106]|uniref:sensor histidine kinase n=1 Tax=Ferruginibacter sp. SUN106 TaxID=2978348 RepID=UPI003D36E9C5
MKKKIIADPLLMIATILIIVGFQVYWIKNNYDREKRLLTSKAGIVFRTAIFEMQAKKLHLPPMTKDSSSHADIKVVLTENGEDNPILIKKSKEQVLGVANALRQQLADSLQKDSTKKTKMVLSVNNSTVLYRNDGGKIQTTASATDSKGKIVQILYGIDSLQDSVKLSDIIAAVQKSFKEEKLPESFSVIPLAVANKNNIPQNDMMEDVEKMDEVSIGFLHPVTYKLQLDNTFGYLFKKILSPLLFSLFLVGVTIFTFLLLYRNLNRQRRLTAIKNEFIGNITHELKTPISTVGVAIEAMQNFNALQNPERTQEYLSIANNELQRLGLLVDKVLKLSMFEKHEVELTEEIFDIKQLVNEVVNSMRLQFEKHHAVIDIHTSGDDFTLTADKMHITSVVYNLLDNALKYSKADPHVTIDINASAANIILKITDNGIGIPAAYTNKIFEKFFRVPSGDKHNVKGYGLGLSYVAHIITQHNGTIDVKSEEGKGTAFTIQLPKENEH